MNEQSTPPQPKNGGPGLGSLPGVPVHYDEPWLGSLLRPLLITLLVACMDVALVAFLRRVVPEWPRAYTGSMLWMGVGAALISGATTTWLVHPRQRLRRNLGYRLAELGLLLAVTRLLAWATTGTWPTLGQLLTYPLDTLFDGFFLLSGFVVTLSWVMAASITADFLDMALQPDELIEPEALSWRTGWVYDYRPQSDRAAILRQFIGRWLTGGVLLILLTAGSQVGFPEGRFPSLIQERIDPVVIGAAVIYFLDGLILTALGRLAVLRARWQIEHTPTSESVLQVWPFYVLLLLLLVGVVAAFLPLGGTFRLAQLLMAVIEFLYMILYVLFTLLVGLLTLLLSLGGAPSSRRPPPPAPRQRPPAQLPEFTLPPWVGGLFFWATVLGILGYAAFVYLSGRGVEWGWLKRLWQALWLRWRRVQASYSLWRASLAVEAEEKALEGKRRVLKRRSRPVTPAQWVKFYYFSMLRLAQERGIPRRRGETPYRYAPRLEEAIHPENERPVSALTDAFVEVRYAAHPPGPEALPELKRKWHQVEKALTQPEDEEESPGADAPRP